MCVYLIHDVLTKIGPPKLHNLKFPISLTVCCLSLSYYVKPISLARLLRPILKREGNELRKSIRAAIVRTRSNVWPETLFSPNVFFYFCLYVHTWCRLEQWGRSALVDLVPLLFVSLLLSVVAEWRFFSMMPEWKPEICSARFVISRRGNERLCDERAKLIQDSNKKIKRGSVF